MPPTNLGGLLRAARLAARLTLEQLAEKSGVSDRAISDMERGVSRGPQARTVDALADALGVDAPARAALAEAARAGRRRRQPLLSTLGLPPRRIGDFTGRVPEQAWITDRLTAAAPGRPAPVVLVTGSPGMGKTSLALHLAAGLGAEFPDGRLFLDLRGLDSRPLSPVTALARLVQAVDPGTRTLPRDPDEAAALWRGAVEGRRMLVVLDNAADEAQVRPLLPGGSTAPVLLTSRRALSGLESVDRLHLEALPGGDAVALLAGIVADRPGSLDRLAELCANVPLALRIAGNRLASRPAWSVDDLVARLGEGEGRLAALAAGDLQVQAAFELSFQQLSPAGQELFRRLALVRGSSIGIELAAVLTGRGAGATEEGLDELAELGLLQYADGRRLQFHDLLRLYATVESRRGDPEAERLAASARADDWLLRTTVLAGRWYEPGFGAPAPGAAEPADLSSVEAARQWLQAEVEEWVPALARAAADGDHPRVIEVAESLHWFSDHWSHGSHWPAVFALSAAAAESLGDDLLIATHLGYLSWAHTNCAQDPAEGLACARRAREAAARAGDPSQQGWAEYYCAWALIFLDRPGEALEHTRASAGHFTAAGETEALPQALSMTGSALQALGRLDEAVTAHLWVISLVSDPATRPQQFAADLLIFSSRLDIGRVRAEQGRWDEAADSLDRAVAAVDRRLTPKALLGALLARAGVLEQSGDPAGAGRDLRAALELQEEVGDRSGAARTRSRLAAHPG